MVVNCLFCRILVLLSDPRASILHLDFGSRREEALMATATATPEETREAAPLSPQRPTTAELAECNCPEFCERDHELD